MDDKGRKEQNKNTFAEGPEGVELCNLGFYICKIEEIPPFLEGLSKNIISVSECLCMHEPQITLCHGWKPDGDQDAYRNELHLSEAEYLTFSNEIQRLFDEQSFFIDGRFTRAEDARYFYETYFDASEYRLISFATEAEYLEVLKKESFQQELQPCKPKAEHILGCDIIGFDMDSFHSFLCNSLQDEFDDIKFSEYGLLDERFVEVKEMAKKIQGKGEPVEWIPVIVLELDKGFCDNMEKSLLEAIEIEKGNIPLKMKKNMPAPTFVSANEE